MEEKKNLLTYAGLKKLEEELHDLKVVKRKDILEGKIQFRPGQRRGIGPQGGPEGHVVLIAHGTDFQPFEIIEGLQIFIGGSQPESSILQDS